MAGRKLKVFQTQAGFYETVVAAPNQAAALRAWGVRQNLFASGEAKVTTDEAVVAAATVHPETPLRRAIGSKDPFVLEPKGLPKIAGGARKAKAKQSAAKTNRSTGDAADRSKLDAAENALRALEQGRKDEESAFQREQEELEARQETAQGVYVDAHKAMAAKVVEARTAFKNAGGED